MFIALEHTLDVPCAAARARLAAQVHGDALNQASHAAHQRGLQGLARVGPLGDVPGASKLVRVRLLDPVCRDGVMTVGLRWEATGTTGGLFPVLDADITLRPAAGDATSLRMIASYRAPLGRLGAGLDKAILHRVATVTIRALFADIAGVLTHPAAAAESRTGRIHRTGRRSSGPGQRGRLAREHTGRAPDAA